MFLVYLYISIVVFLVLQSKCEALDNGLALTPPMGWMSWEHFRCTVDCISHPEDCISEKLFKEIADRLVNDGYLEAGYEYLIIDDCWMSKERDEKGNLQADPERFPSGMKALSDYIHNKGLKFGLYEDYGLYTCEGYPGLIGHMEQDANLFAEWEVDYLKIDGCNADPHDMDAGYTEFGQYLNKTGRPIVYSCSWPFYQELEGMEPNFELIKATCNLWRNYGDISESWSVVRQIMDYFADNQDSIVQHAGPGHWNDPDMLIIGSKGLNVEQAQTQMAIWSVLAAPLLTSADVRNTKSEFREILLNRGAIAINQDPLGIQGKRVYDENNFEVWTKPILPRNSLGDFSYAVAIHNRRRFLASHLITLTLESIGLTSSTSYFFTEIFNDSQQEIQSGGSISVQIPATGVRFFKATVGEI